MDVFTRRLVGIGLERANIDGVAVCRMFNNAIAGQSLPKHLSSDYDPLFRFHRSLANLRILEIEEVKSVPYALVAHPFIERLIGTFGANISFKCFSGTRSTWHGSWTNSAIITTSIACTARSTERRRRSPVHHSERPPSSISTIGSSIVVGLGGERRELGNLDEQIGAGDFGSLRSWPTERFYRHGRKFTAPDIVQRATGEPLSIAPYLSYLNT